MISADPVQMRYRTDAVVDPGDLLRSAAGNWWRVEEVRAVNRRTPSPYAYTWALWVSRLSGRPDPEPDPVPVHTIVRKNRARR